MEENHEQMYENDLRVVSAKASFFCLIFSLRDSASCLAAAIRSAISELLVLILLQKRRRWIIVCSYSQFRNKGFQMASILSNCRLRSYLVVIMP